MRPLLLALLTAIAPTAAIAQKQISGPLRGPINATAGGTAEIDVACAAHHITVSRCPGDAKRIDIPSSRKVIIQIPNCPGEIITVAVRYGSSREWIQINIVP